MYEPKAKRFIATTAWNLNDVIKYLQMSGRADIEQDNYGNIVIYALLHEDEHGVLREGNLNEEGECHV